MNYQSNSSDAPTPLISNRKTPTTPRFSSLDGPILRVEYYREPIISSEAVSANHEVVGAAVQLFLQVSLVVWKRSLSSIAFSFKGRRREARSGFRSPSLQCRPPVLGISNYGQTCFANSILQALAASKSMFEYLEQIRGLSTTGDHLFLVLRQLREGGDASVVDPRPLLRKFYASTHEQNDAQEFLQRMIDSIVDQIDWDAYERHMERSRKTAQQVVVGAMVLNSEDDDSWSTISSCQVAVQKKASMVAKDQGAEKSTVNEDTTFHLAQTISDTCEPAKVKGFCNMDESNGYVSNGSSMPPNRPETIAGNESKQSEDEGSLCDDIHVNFSKDTVISAESVWIHSYSLSEEKKDDNSHLPTGLGVLKEEAFQVGVKTIKQIEEPPQNAYSALSPSPLHGWMGTLLTCDTCKSRDRPIPNALCCTIPILPKHSHLVDCIRSVLAPEHIEHVQCDHCPRDPALEMERQDWINAIRHTSGDTSAMQAELERVEVALKAPIYSNATKASVLMRLPILLSLHIQRRQLDGLKNTQHVHFDESFVINGARYRLIAVIEHLGGPNSGHYVCYRPKWWRISDRQIQQVDWNQVRSAQAYMLFYERVDTVEKTSVGSD